MGVQGMWEAGQDGSCYKGRVGGSRMEGRMVSTGERSKMK